MILKLYDEKQLAKRSQKVVPIRTLNITIEEKPRRRQYPIITNRDLQKFIKNCEASCRRSPEYRELIKFIREEMDYDRCLVLKKLEKKNGRRYTIELHHTPFTLFDICLIVYQKRVQMHEEINPIAIAEEVMELHYNGKVGLVPLSITMHQLLHDDKIFIPMQWVYQDYADFADVYDAWIPEMTKTKIEAMCALSMQCKGDILSNVLDPEFTYLEVDGFQFPEIPEEWGNVIKSVDFENMKLDKAA